MRLYGVGEQIQLARETISHHDRKAGIVGSNIWLLSVLQRLLRTAKNDPQSIHLLRLYLPVHTAVFGQYNSTLACPRAATDLLGSIFSLLIQVLMLISTAVPT